MKLAYPQKISLSAVNAQSAATTTGKIVLWSDVAFQFTHGANPVADTDSIAWPASIPLMIEVTGGEKVGAITGTTGTLYISEVTED